MYVVDELNINVHRFFSISLTGIMNMIKVHSNV